MIAARLFLQNHIRRLSSSGLKYPNLVFHQGWRDEDEMKFAKSFQIFDDFITESEESSFISEMEPHLKRHIYEKDHWDDVSLEKR